MIFRASRERRGVDRWLQLRTLIFLAGSALCIAGLVLEFGLLINVAIGILAVGMLLGVLSRRNVDRMDGEEDIRENASADRQSDG